MVVKMGLKPVALISTIYPRDQQGIAHTPGDVQFDIAGIAAAQGHEDGYRSDVRKVSAGDWCFDRLSVNAYGYMCDRVRRSKLQYAFQASGGTRIPSYGSQLGHEKAVPEARTTVRGRPKVDWRCG